MTKKYGDYTAHEDDIVMNGYRLICTCSACPEQYDVFDDKTTEQVGYLRLRHGMFRADYPECGEETVYTACPKGDGMFDDNERRSYLKQAVRAIHKRRQQDTTSKK